MSFELVLGSAGGARLVFATERELRERELDAHGVAGQERVLVPVQRPVLELSASDSGERLAVAWVERARRGGKVRALLAGERDEVERSGTERPAEAPNVTLELGELPDARNRRGNLRVSASNGSPPRVFWRGEDLDCEARRCAGFNILELSSSGPSLRRVPLTVPEPCGHPLAVFQVSKRSWVYGVCSRRGRKATTTVFNIELDPEFAIARDVLEGCEPLGAVPLDGPTSPTVLVGQCSDGKRAVRVESAHDPPSPISLDGLRTDCVKGKPRLKSIDLELELRGPMERLEPLLPARLAQPGARAVWTGAALLVASWSSGKLAVASHACRAGLFERIR